jgi:lipopolysaccharide/colanic/teichoic acid biosynthesis glycosyltransferase
MLFRTPSAPPLTAATRELERRPVISEELFHDALVRERKRADRFEEGFAILLITLDRLRLGPQAAAQLAESVSRARTGAEVIGWLEQDSVLGLIQSMPPRETGDSATTLANALRWELARCLTSEQASCCAVRCETYSPQSDAVAPVILDPAQHRIRPRHLVRLAAKRALDIVGSAACLVLFAPVFLCAAIAVKWTSKGPVFFRQQRVGEAGRTFTMFKFRTMQVNCDPGIHKQYVEGFIQAAPTATQGAAPFKIVNDPRLTPVGSFLRRSSIDELPQLWNVLRGEMSLVGPRPPLPYEVARYKRWHHRRVLEAKPGMTGLWQVKGRSRTTFDDMVRLDLRYAANSSVWTDCKILLATPKAVLSGKGAR